jgi:hypothetical protein
MLGKRFFVLHLVFALTLIPIFFASIIFVNPQEKPNSAEVCKNISEKINPIYESDSQKYKDFIVVWSDNIQIIEVLVARYKEFGIDTTALMEKITSLKMAVDNYSLIYDSFSRDILVLQTSCGKINTNLELLQISQHHKGIVEIRKVINQTTTNLEKEINLLNI